MADVQTFPCGTRALRPPLWAAVLRGALQRTLVRSFAVLCLKMENEVLMPKPVSVYGKNSSAVIRAETTRCPHCCVEAAQSKASHSLCAIPNAKPRANELSSRIAASRSGPTYVQYQASRAAPGFNPTLAQRLVRIVDAQVDPLEPPKFRHRRAPAAPPSPPPPILRSPPRKLTKEDQALWNIPPCVSNWKNQRGYTVPLDKRIQSDGRRFENEDVTVNDRFASLSEALFVAERTAREEISVRNEILKQKKRLEEQEREQRLRALAAEARAAAAAAAAREDDGFEQAVQRAQAGSQEEQREQREPSSASDAGVSSGAVLGRALRHFGEDIERLVQREAERDIRLTRRSKKVRDVGRDISERIALGQAQPTRNDGGQADSRLYDNNDGLSHGFETGEATYDAPLFVNRIAAGEYRYDPERMRRSVGLGASAVSSNESAPALNAVQFEKDQSDPFGLEQLIFETVKKKRCL